jgi:4a-hydroxytetrahydrobiopterin dehydratase
MALLSSSEAVARLAELPGWRLEGDEIVRQFTFADFVAAMRFVNLVAVEAERVGHHPDIDISWNKVQLALTSHDAGGLTDKDFALAAALDPMAHQ